MKKFLSVLLALAVAFTFTFGSTMSAFAATAVPGTGASYQDKVDWAASELAKEVASAKTNTENKLADKYTETQQNTEGETVTVTIAKDVYLKVSADVSKDYTNVLAIVKDQLEKAYANADTDGKAALDAQSAEDVKAAMASTAVASGVEKYASWKMGDANTEAKYTALVTSAGATTPYKQITLYYAFEAEKARNIAELEKIDLSLYTDDVIDAEHDAYKTTHAQLAKTTKEELIAEAGLVEVANDYTATVIADKITLLQNAVANKTAIVKYVSNIDGTTTVVTRKLVGITLAVTGNPALKTKDELKDADTSLSAQKEQAKATAQNYAATYYNDALAAYNSTTKTATDKANFAKAVAEKDAYLEVQNALIDAALTGPINVAVFTFTELVAANNTYSTYVADYNAVVAYADQCKKMVEKDGSLTYDATIIDKNLKTIKTTIYGGSYNLDTQKAAVTAGAKVAVTDLAFAKAAKIAYLEDARDAKLYNKDGSDKYYPAEKEKITAKYAEVIDKINAATTVEQVNQITGPSAVEINAIKDKDGVVIAIQALSKFTTEANKVQAYLAYVNTGINSWDDAYKTLSNEELATFYAEKGARTNAEIEALLADAKAMVDALPTKKEIADSKAAVKALIAALPNTITLADKPAIKAAYDAEVELGVNADNHARLVAAINAVKALEADSIDKMMKALPAVSKITTADKAAVKDAADAIEEYNTTMMYSDKIGTTAIETYKAAVRDAAANEVLAAIAALNDNSSKAEVEAARAKYDAFVAEYNDPLNNYNPVAVIGSVNGDKLAVLEAKFESAYTDVNAKADLLDMARKLTIWRTSKTSIKVTAVGSVANIKANGYTVKYSFYKKAPGATSYKLVKTTTSNKYTYTNLKKGTNKFQVKVKVYDADGKLVATKMTYYRAAKVK